MVKNRRARSFDIKVTRPPPAAENSEDSAQVTHRLAMEKGLEMLSKEVQDLVEKSRKSTEIIKSVDAGMGALRKQNDEMKSKLDAIANQPPVDNSGSSGNAQPGAPAEVVYQLSQEDLDGIREVAKNMDDAIDSLKDDIPANVEPPKADEGGASQETSSDGSAQPTDDEKQPEVPDAKGHQQDADAASQAKPLDGTAAPADDQK